MQKIFKVFAVLLIVFMFSTSAFAGHSPWTSETTYTGKMMGKLSYGVRNLLGGWTTAFTVPAKHDGNSFEGLGRGLVYAALYTVGGILNTATFMIPIDLPIPNGGVDL